MEFKNKGRDEISRLVSDRQAYISSLELKLEKFSQSTQAYLDIKEKIEKLTNQIAGIEEKVQGINWAIKQQNENNQNQFQQINKQHEDLLLNFSNTNHSGKNIKNSGLDGKIFFSEPKKFTKEFQEMIGLNNEQIKIELDQRFEVFSLKSTMALKGIENKIENIQQNANFAKNEFEKDLEKLIEKNCDVIKDFEQKLEISISMNLERYKELSNKINMSSTTNLSEEIMGLRVKINKYDEFRKKLEENEVRRELEVKEASQSSWNVENLLKKLQNEVYEMKSFERPPAHEPKIEDLIKPYESKIENLAKTVKKYLIVQKSLHQKIEKFSEKIESYRSESFIKTRTDSGEKRDKSSQRKKLSKPEKKLDSSYSPSLNSSRVSILKSTPRVATCKSKSTQKSRIDILYDELSGMFA